MNTIYKEVMLNNIIHEKFNNIKFEFYNSSTGEDLESILCKGISLFKYSSTLLSDEESFPYFVLDITEEKKDKNTITEYLKNHTFSFRQLNGNPTISENNSYSLFKIQGGEIDVTVVCSEIMLIKK